MALRDKITANLKSKKSIAVEVTKAGGRIEFDTISDPVFVMLYEVTRTGKRLGFVMVAKDEIVSLEYEGSPLG